MIKKILLPLVILVAAAAVASLLMRSRTEVATSPHAVTAPLVRVITVDLRPVQLDVVAQGSVLPRIQTQLTARLSGEVRWTAPSFEVGGFFRRGEVLVRLDDRDVELAISRAKAQLAQAKVQVALQEAEAELAADEWRQLGDGEASPLTLRQPQVAQAKASLAAAEADLAKAELDLERTRIVAPFDGRVRSKAVDLGQFVGPGTPLAVIHAIDFAEIRLPVPDDQLRFLDLPFAFHDSASGQPGPDVELSSDFGGRRHTWQGRIVRSEGEVDTRTRMLSLVARVEDPYGRPDGPERTADGASLRPPLAVGLFVDAAISGRTVPQAAVLPRAALRQNSQVLVVDDDNRLRYRPVEVIRTLAGEVYIRSGLEDGEKVCISPLDIVVDGMEVRTQEVAQPTSTPIEPSPTAVDDPEMPPIQVGDAA